MKSRTMLVSVVLAIGFAVTALPIACLSSLDRNPVAAKAPSGETEAYISLGGGGCGLIYTAREPADCWQGWTSYHVDGQWWCGRCQDLVDGCGVECVMIWDELNSHPRCECMEEP